MQLPDYSCALCACGIDEEIGHLLFHCSFSSQCWDTLNLIIPNSSDLTLITESLKRQLQTPFFMEIIVTMCWSIWMMRNDLIFNGVPHSLSRCKAEFKKEFALVILRAKASLHPDIDLWLQNYV
jgi:hypothetical protein